MALEDKVLEACTCSISVRASVVLAAWSRLTSMHDLHGMGCEECLQSLQPFIGVDVQPQLPTNSTQTAFRV